MLVLSKSLRAVAQLVRYLFLFILLLPLKSTLFPYTTLFRSLTQPSRLVQQPDRTHFFQVVVFRSQPENRDAIDARLRERSEEHTSELQSLRHLVCRLLLEKKKCAESGRTPPALASHEYARHR